LESGEVVAGDNGGNLTLRLGEHRCIEDAIRFFVLPKVVPQPFWKSSFHRALAASDGMFQFTISVPVDRQSKHAHKRAHRLRVVTT
jgi:hypothetical protein